MRIISIKEAYKSHWQAQHHDVKISYNDNVWSIVSENQAPDDTLVCFIDKSDGSTFLFRIEQFEGREAFNKEVLEMYLADGLRNIDPDLETTNHDIECFSGQYFYTIDYCFNNKMYGLQSVKHAYIKKQNCVVLMLMAWPTTVNPDEPHKLPLKHVSFIENLKFEF